MTTIYIVSRIDSFHSTHPQEAYTTEAAAESAAAEDSALLVDEIELHD